MSYCVSRRHAGPARMLLLSSSSVRLPVSPSPPSVAYQIDFADRIHIWDPVQFDAFSAENGLSGLADRVRGTSLWIHIHGAEVAALYRALVKTCRADRCPRVLPFRCDAPTVERHLTMRMWSPDGRCVEFSTSIEREVVRDPIALLDHASPRDDRFIVICAWCHALAADRAWVPLERGVELLCLFGPDPMPALSHGVCPRCLTMLIDLKPA